MGTSRVAVGSTFALASGMTKPNRLVTSSTLILFAALLAGCAVEVGDEETFDDETNDATGDVELIAAGGTMEYNVALESYTFDTVGVGPMADGYTSAGAHYGYAYFIKYGDKFHVVDLLRNDGHDVGIHWEDSAAGRQGLCRLRVSTGICDKNLPEGNTIRYQVGRCRPATRDCTRWANYVDRSGWKYTTNNN
jgi:hypothetical protein